MHLHIEMLYAQRWQVCQMAVFENKANQKSDIITTNKNQTFKNS